MSSAGADRRKRDAKDPHFLKRKREAWHRYASKPENQMKIRARSKIKHLCRVGKVQRQPCEVCGDRNTQAHHEDYSKPIDVRWLCQPCHVAEHSEDLRGAGMTGSEMREAMQRGIDRFRNVRTGRVFRLDPAQECLLHESDADEVLLVGFPENPSPRQRGRRWQWLNPKNLEIASPTPEVNPERKPR